MPEYTEKRRHIRFEAPFCVEFQQFESQNNLSGVIKDVGMGGACVVIDSQEPISSEKQVFLSLIFPEATLKVKANVIWQKKDFTKNKLGLSFVQPSDDFKNDIYQQMFRHSRDTLASKWWGS